MHNSPKLMDSCGEVWHAKKQYKIDIGAYKIRFHHYSFEGFMYSCYFRPCSGIVVSGYSKREIDKSFRALIPAVHQYKNFKKMYNVDVIGEFKGKDS